MTLPFAYGREADVYEMPGGRVLRRYRDGDDATREAGVMAHVARFGYPVPAVHEATGSDLIMDRITGPTMASSGLPLGECGEILADLLRRLHAIPAMDEPAAGHSVVHLDLHPENVMITADGPVVIDWRNADDGEPDLDTAFTALILAQVATGSIEHPIGAGAGVILDRFLAVAPGDPLRLLDAAVSLRAGQPTMSAKEVSELPVAAARVRGVK